MPCKSEKKENRPNWGGFVFTDLEKSKGLELLESFLAIMAMMNRPAGGWPECIHHEGII